MRLFEGDGDNRVENISKRHLVRNSTKQLSATRVIATAFVMIILLGTALLMLPVASRNGISCGFRPALFTATSATCVTGLVLFDTWTQWSGFGQAVILTLIEIGGLGFMSVASLVVFVLRRRVGYKQRLVMAQALSLNDMTSVLKLQKWAIFGSLFVQTIGAIVLMLRFLPDYGWRTAVIWGVFHSVSAFCNAGFDILGCITPGGSIMPFASDPVVCLTLMALIVIGGLGFLVWEEIVRLHSFKKLSVYSKLVLLTSGVLILTGGILFCLLEWNNPGTLGNMTAGEKVLNGFFQSVSTRTAGFASFDQAKLTDSGKIVTTMLMFVGGSSGSTAGGMKTVTLVVLLLFMASKARGKESINVFHKTIPQNQVLNAMTIFAIMVGLSLLGSVVICATSPVGFADGLYEAVSALATVGLTAGATPRLSIVAQFLIIVYMYFGRVGVLTISLGFLMGSKAEERFRYAHTNLLIG